MAPHFDRKRYFNPGGAQPRGWRDFLRWKLASQPERSPRFVDDVQPSKPPAIVEGDQLRVTMVNHSTVLLQQHGLNLLTDPIWSERASPLTWIGPRRRRAPGVRWEDLPRIDAVLLSHDHYDHLDVPKLRRLKSEFVVPSGVGWRLRAYGISPFHELDWGESLALGEAVIHCVPAQHFSGRGLFDRNRTLWCGYMIEAAGGMVYFAADTGFGGHFVSIRERFGAPRLALLPIGAYEPRWFMQPVHMSPEEAVRAHRILGAETSIAIHHGTFQLGDEAIDTPARLLRECVTDDSFVVLGNGMVWTSKRSR
jgi:L-ascorbate metabolism protein UlaG (beta-lactamase superfamily)